MNTSSSQFDNFFQQMQRLADDLDRASEDFSKRSADVLANVSQSMQALASYSQDIDRFAASYKEASKRWTRALMILCVELPRRGWYLTGEEPITLIEELVHWVEARDWAAIDEILVKQVARLHLDGDDFQEWLSEQGVPDYCIERVRLVLEYRESENHTVTTIVGMTVIDEICRCLYDGRDFTTKRNKQRRPQLACRTTEDARALSHFAKSFVETSGLIHEDTDRRRLGDEDYFNRAAILHGQIRRGYGPKDLAKVFMLLMFLVFGLECNEGHEEYKHMSERPQVGTNETG